MERTPEDTLILARCVAIWLLLLAAAIGNGGFRETVLQPRLGEHRAHQLSCGLLSAIILGITCITIEWIGASTTRELLGVGSLWVTLTVVFEFTFGRLGRGLPWGALLADYDLLRGRLFLLCLLSALLAPLVTTSLCGSSCPHGDGAEPSSSGALDRPRMLRAE